MLNPEILKILRKKLKRSENTIRKDISLLRRDFGGLPINTVAQIYAHKHKTSVISKLTDDERSKLPNFEVEKPIKLIQKSRGKYKGKQLKLLVTFKSTDSFIQAHIDEVNRCYTYHCYTAAFILCRKIIENMLINIIRKKYPQNSQANVEIYFDTSRRRIKDFSEIISNLKKTSDFGVDQKLLERVLSQADQFKDDANDKTHSLFHIVKNPKELEDKNVQDIIEMLIRLEKNI
ncbi:MAG TPA: hypothetical protein VKU94_02455 [Geobacterales bacterium]|nr:hypothetical protein [Geobacterales bacterium]